MTVSKELEKRGRKWYWSNVRYYSNIFLDGLRKIKINLSHHNHYPTSDSNQQRYHSPHHAWWL